MTIGDDNGNQDPDHRVFRTFTGEGAWDEQAMRQVQADLRARRARDRAQDGGRGGGELADPPESAAPPEVQPQPVPEQNLPAQPQPHQPSTSEQNLPAQRQPHQPPTPEQIFTSAASENIASACTAPATPTSDAAQSDDLDLDPEPAPMPASARLALLAATAIGVLALVSVGVWWIVDATDKHPSPTAVALPTTSQPPAPTTPVSDDVTTGTYSAETDTTDTTIPSPTDTCDPASIVNYYYSAINEGDYDSAWQLGGENLSASYTDFVNGFADTESDQWTAADTSPTTASIQLTATQSDGTVHQYTGTYTVENCVITAAQISAVS